MEPKSINTCKVWNHVVCQHGTNGKRVGRDGGSEAEDVISGGKSEVEAEDEQEVGAEGGAGGGPYIALVTSLDSRGCTAHHMYPPLIAVVSSSDQCHVSLLHLHYHHFMYCCLYIPAAA